MSDTPTNIDSVFNACMYRGHCRRIQRSLEKLQIELAQAKAELAALHTELELLTHKLITCGVAASHPDANLAHTKAYAKQWNSPQAEDVRILRADRDTLRAECERLREDAAEKVLLSGVMKQTVQEP